MDRRTFMKIGAVALTAPLLSHRLLQATASRPVVWEAEGTPQQRVDSLFTAIGDLVKWIPRDMRSSTFLIKPNLCLPHPANMATTTSPDILDALCNTLLRLGAGKIIIADHTLSGFQKSEHLAVETKYPSVKFILANEQRFFLPVTVNGQILKQTEVLKMLSRVDLLINVAAAKHHSATQVSLAMKNLMGLIWDRTEFHTRLDLAQAIADLATVIKPELNIIDAGRVLLSGGPTGPGPVIEENRLFASTDILALDAIAVSRYNFGGRSQSPYEIPHLRAAYRNGIGEIDPAKIDVKRVGDPEG